MTTHSYDDIRPGKNSSVKRHETQLDNKGLDCGISLETLAFRTGDPDGGFFNQILTIHAVDCQIPIRFPGIALYPQELRRLADELDDFIERKSNG